MKKIPVLFLALALCAFAGCTKEPKLINIEEIMEEVLADMDFYGDDEDLLINDDDSLLSDEDPVADADTVKSDDAVAKPDTVDTDDDQLLSDE